MTNFLEKNFLISRAISISNNYRFERVSSPILDSKYTFNEFQVVTGGHYDVDAVVVDPMGKELYKQVKKQYDSFNANASVTGTYKACFSNEFSTFSHKLVYIDFQVGEEEWPVKGAGEKHMTAMTMVSHSSLPVPTVLLVQAF